MFLLELMCHQHHLLSSLPWSPTMAKVMVVIEAVILEGRSSFGRGRDSYDGRQNVVDKGSGNVSIVE